MKKKPVTKRIGQKASDQFQITQQSAGQLVVGEIFQSATEKLSHLSAKGRLATDQSPISA